MAAPTVPHSDHRSSLGGFFARRAREAFGLVLILAGVVLAIALWGFNPNDPSINHAAPGLVRNPLGWFGASLSDLSLQVFGLAIWMVVLVLPAWGLRLVLGRPLAWPWVPLLALPPALLAGAAYLATVPIPQSWPYWVGLGGFVGDFMLHRLERPIGPDTYPTVTAVIAVVSLVLATGITWRDVWALVSAPLGRGDTHEPEPRRRWERTFEDRFAEEPVVASPRHPLSAGFSFVRRFIQGWSGRLRPGREPTDIGIRRAPSTGGGLQTDTETVSPRHKEADNDERTAAPPRPSVDTPPRPRRKKPTENHRAGAEELVPAAEYQLPPLRFLAQPRSRRNVKQDKAVLAETARALEKVLDDFGVRGEIIDIRPGPVVTLFELEPAPGTRAARVIALADDIARSLCAMSVRVAVVPGRNVIGIELPNEQRETVYLRELLSTPAYEASNARLCLALGKDIGGEPVVVDLARMPHLLIAGTTGSGKSVAINAMILSLLYRLSPDECKLILIDPKVIELSVYEDIPHLLAPVVTEPHKAVVALKWVVREMDERYRLMSHLGVRDVGSFNRKIADALARGEQLSRRVQTGFEPGTGVPVFEQQPIEMIKLPMIVVVVDEVADLMLTAGKEIEGAIQRLSQKARAAGIHLIVATQRPSVDVITGVIKANLPSRISFRVSSKIDSRTILGEPGAEQLLGQGDMLFMIPGERITRIHGPLVTEEEVEQVVNYLRTQGEPEYLDAVTDEAALESGGAVGIGLGEGANGEDAQYAQALQIVAQEGKASTSFLQRKMRIGYNSAARLIERMEAEGHISHPDHVGRRQVLIGQQKGEDASPPW